MTKIIYNEVPHEKEKCKEMILEAIIAITETENKVKRMKIAIFIMGEIKHLI